MGGLPHFWNPSIPGSPGSATPVAAATATPRQLGEHGAFGIVVEPEPRGDLGTRAKAP
jgi:hypothetical protein